MNPIQKLTLKLFGRWGTYIKFNQGPGNPFDRVEVKHIPARKRLSAKIIIDNKWHWTWLKKLSKEEYEGHLNA